MNRVSIMSETGIHEGDHEDLGEARQFGLSMLKWNTFCGLRDRWGELMMVVRDALAHLDEEGEPTGMLDGVRSRRRRIMFVFEQVCERLELDCVRIPVEQVKRDGVSSTCPVFSNVEFFIDSEERPDQSGCKATWERESTKVIAKSGETMVVHGLSSRFLDVVVRCREAGEVETLRLLLVCHHLIMMVRVFFVFCGEIPDEEWESRLRIFMSSCREELRILPDAKFFMS